MELEESFYKLLMEDHHYPITAETIRKRQHYVFQDGKTVFKNAVSNMADAAVKILERNNLTKDDVALVSSSSSK